MTGEHMRTPQRRHPLPSFPRPEPDDSVAEFSENRKRFGETEMLKAPTIGFTAYARPGAAGRDRDKLRGGHRAG